jgi:hypothetical protein
MKVDIKYKGAAEQLCSAGTNSRETTDLKARKSPNLPNPMAQTMGD